MSNIQPPANEPPMSLDEARRVIWQAQPKEPMGPLLDRGTITRKDLEWALQKAYRSDMRRAIESLCSRGAPFMEE